MAAAPALYTPEILSLATRLAGWPWDDALQLRGEARSKSCGSTIALGLALDGEGRITRLGLRSHACAIGQAAAAIFADGARGRDGGEVNAALAQIERWLGEGGALPDWSGIEALEPARLYPARHGAIQLAWRAAREALSTGDQPR